MSDVVTVTLPFIMNSRKRQKLKCREQREEYYPCSEKRSSEQWEEKLHVT